VSATSRHSTVLLSFTVQFRDARDQPRGPAMTPASATARDRPYTASQP